MNKPVQLEGARTLTQSAYRLIRGDLLSGSIAPEHKLHIVDLSQRYGTSPSAIREALSRLVAEQLVTVQEQKGFRAAPMSVAEFREITDLRVMLEVQALRRSIEFRRRGMGGRNRRSLLSRFVGAATAGEWRSRRGRRLGGP